jgi:hypothetical protein
MNKNILLQLLVCFFLVTSVSNAQAKYNRKKLVNPFENEGTIDARFNYLYKTSTNYLEYKVISKKGFATVQANVKDSINGLKNLVSEKNTQITQQTKNISSLQAQLESSRTDLETARTAQNSISLFGLQLNKQNYNLIIIIILTSLIVSTVFFIYKYQNSHVLTKDALKNAEDTQREFDIYQKKALERQQVLNRKLTDEIMKNSKD